MARYRDINKLTDEDFFLEQYYFILRDLRDMVNTNDLDRVKFLTFEISNRIKHFCFYKKKLLNRKELYK